MTLRARLTAAFLAVVLGPVLIGSMAVGGVVAAVGRTASSGRFDVAVTAVRATVDATCSRLRGTAQTAAARAEGSQGVLDAARGAAHQVVSRGQAAAARVTDSAGKVVESFGEAPGTWLACAGEQPAGGSVALAGRAEVRDAANRTAGYLEVAEPVDANFLQDLAEATGVEVVLIDDRDPPLSTISEERSRAIARQASDLSGGRMAELDDGWYVRVVEPTRRQPLRLALTTRGGDEQGLFTVLLAVVVFSGVAAVGAAAWLSRSTTRPLAELARAADRVAAGDLDVRVPVRTSDEVGRLANAFNRMTREMRGYVAALTASRDQLRGNLALLGDTLSSTHDLGRILEVILDTAMAATGAQAGVVLLLEDSEGRRAGTLAARCVRGLPGHSRPQQIRLSLGEGLLGGVAASGVPRRGRVGPDGTPLSPAEPRCRTYVAVPFSGTRREEAEHSGDAPGRLLGVLALYDRLGHDDFDDADLVTLRTFAGQAAVAVENVLLHEETHRLSLTDPLTGLWNFRYLMESVRREVERANRFGRTLAVLALDIDRFKAINETYGHPVGDAVLVEFARRMRGETREVDLSFRQGADEFMVLLPETDAAGATRVAERLCSAIRSRPFDVDDGEGPRGPVPVTASVGIAVFPDHGDTASALLAAADDAVYAAKAAGRDTHRTAGPTV